MLQPQYFGAPGHCFDINGDWWHKPGSCEMCGESEYSQLLRIRELIQLWMDKQGHDSCWYYPDIFEQIRDVLNMKMDNKANISRAEFEEGCRRYQKELYERVQS